MNCTDCCGTGVITKYFNAFTKAIFFCRYCSLGRQLAELEVKRAYLVKLKEVPPYYIGGCI